MPIFMRAPLWRPAPPRQVVSGLTTEGHGGTQRGQSKENYERRACRPWRKIHKKGEDFGVRWLDTALDRTAETAILTPSLPSRRHGRKACQAEGMDAKRFSGGSRPAQPWRGSVLPGIGRGNSRSHAKARSGEGGQETGGRGARSEGGSPNKQGQPFHPKAQRGDPFGVRRLDAAFDQQPFLTGFTGCSGLWGRIDQQCSIND